MAAGRHFLPLLVKRDMMPPPVAEPWSESKRPDFFICSRARSVFCADFSFARRVGVSVSREGMTSACEGGVGLLSRLRPLRRGAGRAGASRGSAPISPPWDPSP